MTDTITLSREVIERAISALQRCYDVDSYPSDGSTQQDAALNELSAALAQQAEQGQEADWKSIALQLAQRVNFAVTNLNSSGGGMLDLSTGKITGWRDYMVEGMELVPGVKVDREILQTLGLPPSKRKAAQLKIKAERAAEPKGDV